MIDLLELLAVASSALFGLLLARSKGMDLVGICWVTFIVAFGGGTLRDVLLDRRPLFWIESEHYAWLVCGIAILGSPLPRLPRRLESWLLLPDALGLALFSIVGTRIALEMPGQEISPFIAAMFGVITGSFGGVIADVVCNDIPRMFLPAAPLYSICAFSGCWVYLGLRLLGAPEDLAMSIGVAVIVVFRLAAVRWNWKLPVFGA